jgi:hypothetical protein
MKDLISDNYPCFGRGKEYKDVQEKKVSQNA